MRLSFLNLSKACFAMAFCGVGVYADDPSTTTPVAESVSTTSSLDAYRDLPANHVLRRSAEGVVEIQIDMAGVDKNQDLRVAAFDGRGMFVDSQINGSTLSLYGVDPGPISVVVNGSSAHAAAIFVVSDGESLAATPDLDNKDETLVANRTSEMMSQLKLTSISPDKVKETLARLNTDIQGRVSKLESMQVGQPSNGFVKLGANGELSGRVMSITNVVPESMMVYVFSGNRLVVTADTDSLGRFTVPGIEPGAYNIVASGPAGYSAFGFVAGSATDAVASKSIASATSVLVNRVLQEDPATVLPVPVIPQPLLDPTIEQIDDEEIIILEPGVAATPVDGYYGAPVASPFGGFSGGGGGAGGGIGGFGGIGGAGAAAAIIAATSDDDNDAITAPVTSSPVVPN
ncbi:MAG: hypothetical protein AAF664_18080 [Planctomycetota bacterium]